MSVSKFLPAMAVVRLYRFALLGIGVAMAGTSIAAAPMNTVETAWSDPLATRPTVLDHGRVLPGDSAKVECSQSSPIDEPLSLGRAVDLALCNNPKIKDAWLGIKVQAAALGIAEAALLPTVSINMGRERSATGYANSPFPSSSATGNTAYASLNWRLFDFGARTAERESANYMLVGAIQSHDAALQKIMEDTIQAYFDAQSAHAVWLAKKEGERIASATLDSAKRREGRGAMAQGDILQAAAAQAHASLDLNRAFGDYRKACAVLIYMMGIPSDSDVVLADIDAVAESPADMTQHTKNDLDEWLREVQRTHPSILAARSQWEAARATVKATRASGLPTVDFSANYYKNGYPNQGISATGSHVGTVGISVSFPIFTGFSYTYKVRQAEATAEQRETKLVEIEHEILTELVKAYSDACSALESLDASSLLLKTAQEALVSSQRKYDKGASDIVEILNSQKELAGAKQERVRAISDWRSARLRLMAAAGQLGRTRLEMITLTSGERNSLPKPLSKR
jgi:outer membrane protein